MFSNKFQQLKKKICQRLKPKARRGSIAWGWLFAIPVLGPGAIVFALAPKVVTEWFTGKAEQAFAAIIGIMAKLAILVFGGLIQLVTTLIVGIAQYNNFVNEEAVKEAWAIVRDIGNMFFIIVFLVMAVGTILKKEQYSWQKMLIPLALMAIFINFSRTICGLIIDFAQVIMLTFVNGFKDVGGGNLLKLLGMDRFLAWDKFFQNKEVVLENVGAVTSAQLIGLYWLAAVLSFVALVVLSIVAIVLILRIIALWFLVILSPIAFIFYVVPGAQQYAKKWQDAFFKNVITGPVIAFFIWVSFLIVEKSINIVQTDHKDKIEALMDGKTVPVLGQVGFYIGYIFGIGLLIGSLVAAKQLGGVGASMAGKGIGFIQKAGTKTAAWAGRRVDAAGKFASKHAGRSFTGLASAGFKSAAFAMTGRGKQVGGIWKEYKDKTLKPIVAPAQRIYSSLASVFGSDPGPDARIAKTQGWRALWTGGSLAGKLTHKTTDVKDLRKLIATYIKNGSLDQAGKDQIKDILKRNKPTLGTTNVKDFQELVDNFSVYERPTNADQHIKDGLQSLIPELRKAGLGEKIEREEVIDLLLRSTEGTQIINAINTGGLSQKKADDLIEEIMDNIGRGNYSTTPTFNGQKINADILKNSLASIIPVTAPKSGSEREKMLGGTAGTIHHEMSEVIDKHKPGSSSRTALTAFQTTIEGRLNASLRAGIISITDKNGIKKQIEKELDNLVKAKTIEENEADQIKEKLYFQIETMPVAKMKPGEFWKEVSKNMAKWSGKKLSVPFSILAATFESLRDHGGIPIFDFDILTKEIKNFNARRTRRREADKLGQWHDVMNLWISLGKDKTDYKGTELMSRVSEEKKMVYDKTQGETHATLNELYDAWQAGDHPKAVGAYMILAENNDLNELWKGDFSGKFLPIMKNMLETQYVGKNVRVWDDTSKSYSNKTINQKEIGQIIQTSKEKGGVNIGFARLFTENLTKLAGKSDAVAAKLGNMIGMIALENGSPHMGYGASSYNPKTERMEFAPLEIFVDNSGRLDFTLSRRSMSEITAKLKNMSQRKVTNMIHPGMFAQEDINGQMRGINPLNESFLMTLSSTLLERPHEMRDDVVTKLTASSEWRGSITRLVSDMMINADYYLRYYSDYFASREDVLKQARLISQFPARLLASRYKEFNK